MTPSSGLRTNDTYTDNITLNIAGTAGRFLMIEAEDGFRPHLRPSNPIRIQGANEDFTLTLGGLLIEGVVEIPGSLGSLAADPFNTCTRWLNRRARSRCARPATRTTAAVHSCLSRVGRGSCEYRAAD